MVDGIGTSSGVKGIAVGKEWFSSQRTYHVNYSCSIVRTYICHVARLAEMNLDGSEFAFEIDVCYSSPSDKTLKLCQEVIARYGPEIRVKYF